MLIKFFIILVCNRLKQKTLKKPMLNFMSETISNKRNQSQSNLTKLILWVQMWSNLVKFVKFGEIRWNSVKFGEIRSNLDHRGWTNDSIFLIRSNSENRVIRPNSHSVKNEFLKSEFVRDYKLGSAFGRCSGTWASLIPKLVGALCNGLSCLTDQFKAKGVKKEDKLGKIKSVRQWFSTSFSY